MDADGTAERSGDSGSEPGRDGSPVIRQQSKEYQSLVAASTAAEVTSNAEGSISSTVKGMSAVGSDSFIMSDSCSASGTSIASTKNGDRKSSSKAKGETGETKSDEDVDVESEEDDGTHSKKKKLDRSKLRKGKWTIEEEEYTSRIIHYFSVGLISLPEGATLRSYLADKLNCDPMRVTKKYAGASCLGRRVFQARDKPQPSMLEVQLAKAELDMLERRYKTRVEEGRPGAPLPSQLDIALGLAQANPVAQVPSVQGYPWLSLNEAPRTPLEAGIGRLTLQNLQALARNLAPAPAPAALAPSLNLHHVLQQHMPSLAPPNATGGNTLNLDVALAQVLLQASNQVQSVSPQDIAIAIARQQHALPRQPEPLVSASQALPSFTPSTPATNLAGNHSNNFLDELRKTYERHLASQAADNGPLAANFNAHIVASPGNAVSANAVGRSAYNPPRADNGPSAPIFPANNNTKATQLVASPREEAVSKQTHKNSKTDLDAAGFKDSSGRDHLVSKGSGSPRSRAAHKPALPVRSHLRQKSPQTVPSAATDQKAHGSTKVVPRTEDGAILMGFLNSLRSSFETAVAQQQEQRKREQQEDSEETNSSDERQESLGGRRRPATVTDSSSQHQGSCSSVDESDWNSEDKKTDPSSSEDSDKDDNQDADQVNNYKEVTHYSKGPPRKRLKKNDSTTEVRAD